MCFSLRNTHKRGRAASPRSLFRTRAWRNLRALDRWLLNIRSVSSGSSGSRADGLPRLAANLLLYVLDSFALVRLGRTKLANRGRRLPQHLAIGTLERDHGLLVDLRLDAVGQRKHD